MLLSKIKNKNKPLERKKQIKIKLNRTQFKIDISYLKKKTKNSCLCKSLLTTKMNKILIASVFILAIFSETNGLECYQCKVAAPNR